MAKKGKNIYKRKDGRWEGRYKVFDEFTGDYKYKSIYGNTYSEACEKLYHNQANNKTLTKKSSMTVEYLFTLWLNSIKFKVKSSTYANYIFKLEKHIYPELGKIKYDFLSISAIESFILKKINSGLSEKYIKDMVILFKSLGKFAYQTYRYNNLIQNIRTPQAAYPEIVILSKRETNSLVEKSIQGFKDGTKLGILLSLFTGIRIGELCALKWSDVDFNERIIKITKTMQRVKTLNPNLKTKTEVIITSPKSRKSKREIPLPPVLNDLLEKAKKENDCYILSGTEKIIEPRLLQYRFKVFLKKENLLIINFHLLRHMFATNCMSLGFDLKTLSEILGHSSERITISKYVHSSNERKRECMNLLQLPESIAF